MRGPWDGSGLRLMPPLLREIAAAILKNATGAGQVNGGMVYAAALAVFWGRRKPASRAKLRIACARSQRPFQLTLPGRTATCPAAGVERRTARKSMAPARIRAFAKLPHLMAGTVKTGGARAKRQ